MIMEADRAGVSGLGPNQLAFAKLLQTMRCPAEDAVLFALGRTVGWIAHLIEQYSTDELIRPRARYTGPAPGG